MTILEAAMDMATFFGAIWNFMKGVTIPIIDISAAALLVAGFLANIGLRLLGKVIGISPHLTSGDISSAGNLTKKNK